MSSVVKSLRISKNMLEKLTSESKNKNLDTSKLINIILHKHVNKKNKNNKTKHTIMKDIKELKQSQLVLLNIVNKLLDNSTDILNNTTDSLHGNMLVYKTTRKEIFDEIEKRQEDRKLKAPLW